VTSKRVLSTSFLAGLLGGVLAVAVGLAVLVLSGGARSTTKTLTVVEDPVAPVRVVDRGSGPIARQVYERDAPGVVFVNASDASETQSAGEYLKGEGGGQGTATGSGFEIDGKGTILTNWHVVEGATKITIGFAHGKTVAANLIDKDPSLDIAVLRIPTDGLVLHPLALGDSGQARVGDPVLAIGNPFGLARTLTTGVISALERKIEAPNGLTIDDVLQTDAPINPGNSGGPLLDEAGAVIGINSQIETGGEHGGNVGIAFAIPIDSVKGELARLAKGASVVSR
jgi:S1-C subfamily serine protease